MGTERAVQRRQPGGASRAIPGAGHTSAAATPCPSVDGYAPKSPETIPYSRLFPFPDFFRFLVSLQSLRGQSTVKLFLVAHGLLEYCWNLEALAYDGSSARTLDLLNTWLCRPR